MYTTPTCQNPVFLFKIRIMNAMEAAHSLVCVVKKVTKMYFSEIAKGRSSKKDDRIVLFGRSKVPGRLKDDRPNRPKRTINQRYGRRTGMSYVLCLPERRMCYDETKNAFRRSNKHTPPHPRAFVIIDPSPGFCKH